AGDHGTDERAGGVDRVAADEGRAGKRGTGDAVAKLEVVETGGAAGVEPGGEARAALEVAAGRDGADGGCAGVALGGEPAGAGAALRAINDAVAGLRAATDDGRAGVGRAGYETGGQESGIRIAAGPEVERPALVGGVVAAGLGGADVI